jgi:vacuolar iron transporter family protein
VKKLSVHEKGTFLSDVVFSASDGLVTTFAVVAGSAGALLDSRVVLILGFANLFADGFSMASGNYLGVKSEVEYEELEGKKGLKEGSPVIHALLTFVAFIVAGLIPLLPFVLKLEPRYGFSSIFCAAGLFFVGVLRNIFTKKGFVKSGVESLLVGGMAAFVAFISGYLIDKYLI